MRIKFIQATSTTYHFSCASRVFTLLVHSPSTLALQMNNATKFYTRTPDINEFIQALPYEVYIKGLLTEHPVALMLRKFRDK